MRLLLLLFIIIVTLPGCANKEPPPQIHAAEPPGNGPVQRLIRDTMEVDRARMHLDVAPKTAPNPAFAARELGLVVTLAEEALLTARGVLLAGDMATFERSLQVVRELMDEFHGRVASFESERQLAEAERREAAAYRARQRAKKEKP